MRAVLCEGTDAFVAEVPDPVAAPDEVIIEVDACGLCGSDVHALQAGQVGPGQILGHEFSGRVAALGREVTGWQEGQPVAASPLGSCGQCRICARGLAFRCEAAPNIGITRAGAYAQYVAVPARQLVALPAGLPVEVGSHAEPLSVALEAVSLARVGPGDPVLVYGVGPIGLYAIIGLRMAGAGPIVAAGRSAGRREAAAAVGADAVLDTRRTPVPAYVRESGVRFAAVLECSASPGAFTEAMTVTEPGGTVVEVALTPEAPPLPLFGLVSEGLHLVGACAFSDETYRTAVGHLASGQAPVERLVSERVTLDATPQALVRLRTPGSLVRVISRPQATGTAPSFLARTTRTTSRIVKETAAMEDFAGRTAVITGAGSGMGKAFALRWAAEGMNVVLGDIQQDALDAVVAEISSAGGPVAGLRTDVSSLDDVQALAELAEDTFGPVHLVHNNAGVEGYLDGPIWAATDRDWEWTVGVNFWSVVHGVRTFVPRLLAHGQQAHIVNTCSMTSVTAATNLYGITKHATIALSEVLWSDLRRAGAPIGVTALCPGTIATNLFHGSRNRPASLTDEAGNISAEGKELRDRMHLVLAAGMPPSEVASKVVDKVRGQDGLYLLTDHEWDEQVIARHEAIIASAVLALFVKWRPWMGGRFEGKVAVVTGAAAGFGLEVSGRLAADGARVVMVDWAAEALRAGADQLGQLAVVADVSQEGDVDGYVAAAVGAYGRIDLFHNNAGIEGRMAPMTELDVADFDRVMAVNARGVFLGLRAVLRVMKAQRSGAIVNSASMAAIKGAATFSPYIASKHAVLGLTKSAALEGGPFGIRVNCVAPGHIDTRMARDLTRQINPDDPEGVFQEVSATVPLYGRYGTASEVASLVLFLLSDEAAYISGSLHLIDGALNAG